MSRAVLFVPTWSHRTDPLEALGGELLRQLDELLAFVVVVRGDVGLAEEVVVLGVVDAVDRPFGPTGAPWVPRDDVEPVGEYPVRTSRWRSSASVAPSAPGPPGC